MGGWSPALVERRWVTMLPEPLHVNCIFLYQKLFRYTPVGIAALKGIRFWYIPNTEAAIALLRHHTHFKNFYILLHFENNPFAYCTGLQNAGSVAQAFEHFIPQWILATEDVSFYQGFKLFFV